MSEVYLCPHSLFPALRIYCRCILNVLFPNVDYYVVTAHYNSQFYYLILTFSFEKLLLDKIYVPQKLTNILEVLKSVIATLFFLILKWRTSQFFYLVITFCVGTQYKDIFYLLTL